jgi:SOS-response transcriptional repressor LexA
MSWTTRVKSRMKELEMTQETLAHKMGITRGAVTHYLAGRRVPPLKQFQKLATILKADPAWLQFGTKAENKSNKLVTTNEKSTPIQNRIPILSWEQASIFIDPTKIDPSEIKEYLPDFYTSHSHWYALRVKGDSMTSPLSNGTSFNENNLIIVDTNKEPKSGDFVIALLPRSKEVTFKQYVIDSGVHYLKPLNPQYPMITIESTNRIRGTAITYLEIL